MKQLINNINAKHLVALTIVAILFWFFSPLLFINGQFLFQTPEKRTYLIALLYLGWALYIYATLPQLSHLPKNPDDLTKLTTQEGRFQGAIQFLKKTFINKHGKNVNLSHLPWYLLIGPSGSGKTTLLANANVSFILTKQFKQEKITSSDACNWWVTRDIVLVDVPGVYLKDNESFLWHNFLRLMKKNHHAQTLSTVVIALPFPELLKQSNPQIKKQLAADIKRKITQLRDEFGQQLHFQFAITKCDLLPGFTEFFGESSTEELAQAWGVTIPTCKENENLIEMFTQRFNGLIKRLNSQLIWRLQQERNSNARPAIKDFPLQIERLRETITNFLKALAIPDLHLQGVYLTSAMQSISEKHAAQLQIINPNTHQALQLQRTPAMPSKAYFIRHFILTGLLSDADQPIKLVAKTQWSRYLTYAASIGIVIAATVLLGRDFQQSVLQTYAIQNDLAQYQLAIQQPSQQEDHLIKALPLLNALEATATRNNSNLSRLANLMSFYSDKSQKTAQIVYQQALQTIVLAEIKNSLENYLKNTADKNPAQVYGVLKAYLMLGDAKNLQVDYILTTLQQISPMTLSKQLNDDLVNHVHAAFNQLAQPLEINSSIIAEARKQLISLPAPDLAFVILKNINANGINNSINIDSNANHKPIFSNKQNNNPIPTLYTESVFSAALTQEIPVVANEALQGNWVLGNAEVLSNDATINALTEQLRTKYVANYVEIWEGLLSNIKLNTPTNLSDADAIVADLMSDSSPLLKFLDTIKRNTSFEPIMNASPKLQALNNLLMNAHNDQQNTLYQIFVELRQLHFYLQNIITASDAQQAAFVAAKNRMQNPADVISQIHILSEQNPEPMKSWLNNLATQSWYFILQDASHHIENTWQLNVLNIYHSQIANPEIEELDSQQFATFVGKQGTLASFYANYLQPFVNDDGKQWQWRTIDNQKLPFSSNALAQLQQTTKLQRLSKYVLFTQVHTNPGLRAIQLPEKWSI